MLQSPAEFEELLNGLPVLSRALLVNLIKELSVANGYTALSSVAPFIKNLARNGPARSLVQGAMQKTNPTVSGYS